LYEVYADFGFTDILVKLSTRPEKRVGSDVVWDKAEQDLTQALDSKKLNWQLNPGEGAFYGPKIEFSLRDCIGRVWQCGTLQLDFSMPERLGAFYIAEDNSRKIPVMLHRAVFGAFERFIGIVIEHYAGILPPWLAPTQVAVMNITDKQADFVTQIIEKLKKEGFRAKSDLRNEKIGFKIREHTLQRVPFQLIIGERELETQTVTVRTQAGKDLGNMPLSNFTTLLSQAIERRGRIFLED
ncbi:MAG: His/Gly/Thr/Pro-type tRNA ligase C-terminal domain-containing protein, partial [Gammaproteobacteria bacterium]